MVFLVCLAQLLIQTQSSIYSLHVKRQLFCFLVCPRELPIQTYSFNILKRCVSVISFKCILVSILLIICYERCLEILLLPWVYWFIPIGFTKLQNTFWSRLIEIQMSFSVEERFTHINEISFIIPRELFDEHNFGTVLGVWVVLGKQVIGFESFLMRIGAS